MRFGRPKGKSMTSGPGRNLSKVLSGFHKNPRGQGKMHGSGMFDDDSLTRGYMKSAEEKPQPQPERPDPKLVGTGIARNAAEAIKKNREEKERQLKELEDS